MSSVLFLIACFQAVFVQNVFGQCGCGGGRYAENTYSNGMGINGALSGASLGGLESSLAAGYSSGAAYGNTGATFASIPAGLGSANAGYSTGVYGGIGNGNMAVYGEMPVEGITVVSGQVPAMGLINFNGPVPAGGTVSIAGSSTGGWASRCGCDCGCARQLHY